MRLEDKFAPCPDLGAYMGIIVSRQGTRREKEAEGQRVAIHWPKDGLTFESNSLSSPRLALLRVGG